MSPLSFLFKPVLAGSIALQLLAWPLSASYAMADDAGFPLSINVNNTAYVSQPTRQLTWEESPSVLRHFEDSVAPAADETRALELPVAAVSTLSEPTLIEPVPLNTTVLSPVASVLQPTSQSLPQVAPRLEPDQAASPLSLPPAVNTAEVHVSVVEQPAPVAASFSPMLITPEHPSALVTPSLESPSPVPALPRTATYQAVSGPVTNLVMAHSALSRKESKAALLDSDSKILESVISTTATHVELTKDKALLINLNTPIKRATISNSEIAKAAVLSPTQIQLIGITLGSANLILWPSDHGPQEVVDITVHADLTAIRNQLKAINESFNLSASSANTLMLTGQTELSEEAQLAKEISRSFFAASTAGANGQSAPPPGIINLIQIHGKPSTKLSLVQDKLAHIHPNIRIDMVPGPDGNDKAVLTGTVPSADIVSKAINTASIFYGAPGLKVITGPGGNAVSSQATEAFHSGDSFSSNLATNVLQGSIITDSTGNVVSMLRVAERPQIRCTIQFLEISRTDLDQLGSSVQGFSGNTGMANLIGRQNSARSFSSINAAGSTTALSVPAAANLTSTTALTQTIADGATQVFTLGQRGSVILSALIEKRQVRSLAEPTLTMLSGEKASFLAGGEVPIPVSMVNGQISVSFKDFGIRLNLIPTVVEQDLIHLQVAPEVSTVDSTIFVSAGSINIPGFRTRRMQTTLEMQNGEQLVLAGLYNTEDIRTISRTPLLGNIPILGSFFSNKSRDKDKNEMIVIIRPEIIRTAVTEPVNDGEWSGMRSKLNDTMTDSKAEQDENVSKHLIRLPGQ